MSAFRVTLQRSGIGLPKKTNAVLKYLGLTHRGAVRYTDITPSYATQILRVKELVKVDIVPRRLTRQEHNATLKTNSGYVVEKQTSERK
ncbi:mitochondrial 54S ribosomal protein uL30m [Kockiozyma suomiensis]|uniref:mitochondrial 54S ribosomal protein uL30m n=1 Tax=Kockiozyma suomiensis TaxID=1337062 RepID=UPI00334332CC